MHDQLRTMDYDTRSRIGRCLFDPAASIVEADGIRTVLEPKATKVLLYLCARVGSVCSRGEIIDAVWEEQFVSDGAVNRVVSQVRKALAEDAYLLETIRKVGYRLAEAEPTAETIGPRPTEVTTSGRPAEDPAGEGSRASGLAGVGSLRAWLLGAAAAALVVGGGLATRHQLEISVDATEDVVETLEGTSRRTSWTLTFDPEEEVEIPVLIGRLEESLERAGLPTSDRLLEVGRLATLYNQLGRHSEAAALLRNHLDEPREGESVSVEQRVTLGLLLGESLLASGDTESARGTLQGVAALVEAQATVSKSDLAEVRRLEGLLALRSGRRVEAERLLVTALELQRQAVGDEHPRLARCLYDLAQARWGSGRYPEAELAAREALEARRRLDGPHHLDVAASLAILAQIRRSQGVLDEALDLARRATQVTMVSVGSHRSELVIDRQILLADSLQGVEQFHEARDLYRQAREVAREILADDDPRHVSLAHGQALSEWRLGNSEEAEALFRQALEQRRGQFGDQHPKVALIRHDLAAVLHQRGAQAEAEALELSALEVFRASLGADHPKTLHSEVGLARIYLATGRADEAAPLLDRVLEVRRQVLDPKTLLLRETEALVRQARGVRGPQGS